MRLALGCGDCEPEQRILLGNDRKKSKGKSKSRFPSGMTNKRANATAKADSLGNDKQKSKGNSKGRFSWD